MVKAYGAKGNRTSVARGMFLARARKAVLQVC